MEAGPGVMLDALGELAASGQITDTETLANIGPPASDAVGETPAPDADTLALIRGRVADEVAETYPAFATRVFGGTASAA